MSIDWNLWLPPAELPDTGDKNFRVGQVWAYTISGRKRVAKLRGAGYCLILAAEDPHAVGDHGSFMAGGNHQKHAVFLSESIDIEPPDPDLIYQFLYK